MEVFRLFTAIVPPPETLEKVQAAQRALQEATVPGTIRWIGATNLHITMHFLGDTPSDRVPAVVDALLAGIEQWGLAGEPSISLSVGTVGAFPGARRPRAIWVRVHDASRQLVRLQQTVGDQLRESGFEPEDKPFRPHITIGYVRRRTTGEQTKPISRAIHSAAGEGQSGYGASVSTRAAPEFLIHRLVLMRSRLSSSGAEYSVVHSSSLAPASSSTSSGESARA